MYNIISTSRAVARSATFLLGIMSTFSVGALIASGSTSAHAQDFSPFATTFGVGPAGMAGSGVLTGGVLSPDGSTITFPLVQQSLLSLTSTLNGTTEPVPPEQAASGYVAVKQLSPSDPTAFLVTGAFPVRKENLVAFEQALVAAGLPFTSIDSQLVGINGAEVVTVHTQASLYGTTVQSVATQLESVLTTIGNPQQSNQSITGPLAIANVPKRFQALLTNGSFSILNGTIIIYALPFADTTSISIGGTPASQSLGVGQTVTVSGSGYAVVTTELTLRPKDVTRVTGLLATAGWVFSSESEQFTGTSPKLTTLHAAFDTTDVTVFETKLLALGKALNGLDK